MTIASEANAAAGVLRAKRAQRGYLFASQFEKGT
jgi:hypothetical protein